MFKLKRKSDVPRSGQCLTEDVDGIVSILDFVLISAFSRKEWQSYRWCQATTLISLNSLKLLVRWVLGQSATSAHPQTYEIDTATRRQHWLHAQRKPHRCYLSTRYSHASLLAGRPQRNMPLPSPFNPETWIPYVISGR